MASARKQTTLPAWIKRPPAPDEAHVHVTIGAKSTLTAAGYRAVERLARELVKRDVTRARPKAPPCPCKIPKSLMVCKRNKA